MIHYDPLHRVWRLTLAAWHVYWTDEFMTMNTPRARFFRAITRGVRAGRHLTDAGF